MIPSVAAWTTAQADVAGGAGAVGRDVDVGAGGAGAVEGEADELDVGQAAAHDAGDELAGAGPEDGALAGVGGEGDGGGPGGAALLELVDEVVGVGAAAEVEGVAGAEQAGPLGQRGERPVDGAGAFVRPGGRDIIDLSCRGHAPCPPLPRCRGSMGNRPSPPPTGHRILSPPSEGP